MYCWRMETLSHPVDGTSDWMTSEEVAQFLRFPSIFAFYEWRRRHHWPRGQKFGRRLLFLRQEVHDVPEEFRVAGSQAPPA